MGQIHSFTAEKLIIGVLCSDSSWRSEAESLLEDEFGPIDYRSEVLPFNYTSYYDEEMGSDIERYFIAFQELVAPDLLAPIKLRTNELETRFTEEGKRKINLDPGLLSLGKLILASTKDNAQRIPLSRGIYGEITLIYKKKKYQALPWTYPDYQSPEYSKILQEIRSLYKRQIEA